jgi:hypothetical protein
MGAGSRAIKSPRAGQADSVTRGGSKYEGGNGEIGLTSPLIIGWSGAAQLSSDAELVMGIAPAAIQRPPARIRKSGLEQLGMLEKTPEN